MAPTTHTLAPAEFHCLYCSQPCKGSGDHMVCSCPVVLAAAFSGFTGLCALLRSPGYAVCWRDSLGATVYDRGAHPALEARAGRGRGRIFQERRLGRGCHVVWAYVGQGPATLARS